MGGHFHAGAGAEHIALDESLVAAGQHEAEAARPVRRGARQCEKSVEAGPELALLAVVEIAECGREDRQRDEALLPVDDIDHRFVRLTSALARPAPPAGTVEQQDRTEEIVALTGGGIGDPGRTLEIVEKLQGFIAGPRIGALVGGNSESERPAHEIGDGE